MVMEKYVDVWCFGANGSDLGWSERARGASGGAKGLVVKDRR